MLLTVVSELLLVDFRNGRRMQRNVHATTLQRRRPARFLLPLPPALDTVGITVYSIVNALERRRLVPPPATTAM